VPIRQNHYALVVGIDDYPDYRSLNGAKQDALDFVDWLRNSDRGGGLPPENLKLVLSEPNPPRPYQHEIDDGLSEIWSATKGSPAERLYIYFSGHGLARSNLATDLCLAKWSRLRMGLALDSQDYLDVVLSSANFREVVMLLDCCRVRLVRRRALPSTIDLARPGEAQQSRAFIAYATEFQSKAYEAATDEEFEDDDDTRPIVRGHFTHALIDGLKGGAARAGSGVTASSLKEYLELHTPEVARQAGHKQKPEIINGFSATDDPKFGDAMPPASGVVLKVEFGPARSGDELVLENGTLDLVRRGDASSGPWEIPGLPRGQYLLRDMGNGDERSVRITGAEETVNVVF
jgi:hypothetical protein